MMRRRSAGPRTWTKTSLVFCLVSLACFLSLAQGWSFGSLFGTQQNDAYDATNFRVNMAEDHLQAKAKFSWYPTESFEVKDEESLRKVISAARPGKDVIVLELFANWCGHCRKYKDTFEEIANYFNKGYDPEEHEARVIVSRIDCGHWDKENVRNLCKKFQVKGFPQMHYGFADDYLEVLSHEPPPDPEPKEEEEEEETKEEKEKESGKEEEEDEGGFKVDEVLHKMPHNARGPPDVYGVVSIVEVYLNSELGLPAGTKFGKATGIYEEEVKRQRMAEEAAAKPAAQVAYEPPNHMDVLHDIEMSTQMSLLYLATSMNLGKEGAYHAFHEWQTWIAKHHPSARCMKGARAILSQLDDIWPAKASVEQVEANFRNVTQCGEGVSTNEDDFKQCKEFSCGLWQTFHAMSVHKESPIMSGSTNYEWNNFKAREKRRVEGKFVEKQDRTGAGMMSALNSFIDYFFMCMVCRTHFLEVLAGEETKDVVTQKDFVLWLWRSHNVVSKRLGKEEEESNSGDPERPKHQYPDRNECRGCFQVMEENYDEESIYTFLKESYSFASNVRSGKTTSSSGYVDVLADYENPTGAEEEGSSWFKVGSLAFLIICALSFLALYTKKRMKVTKTYKSHYGYTV